VRYLSLLVAQNNCNAHALILLEVSLSLLCNIFFFPLRIMVDLSVHSFVVPEPPRYTLVMNNAASLFSPAANRNSTSSSIHGATAMVKDEASDSSAINMIRIKKSKKHKGKKKKKKNIQQGNNNNVPIMVGNLPDVHWRAIPMDHLRMHPQVDALPRALQKLDHIEDVRYFRQDSWQWDALHDGRCTTSQLPSALGFLEPNASQILQIPKSWCRNRRDGDSANSAYHRLRRPALRTIHQMREVLLKQDTSSTAGNNNRGEERMEEETPWCQPPPTPHPHPFAATYIPSTRSGASDQEHRQRQRYHAAASVGKGTNILKIKMMWGSAQEATALLTALNYFYQQDPLLRLQEVGMCGASLTLTMDKHSNNELLLVGASPDALLCYSDGTKEVLEVKNHCPFTVRKKWKKAHGHHHHQPSKNYEVQSFTFPPKPPYLQPLYVPQLMMEMLCTNTSSAVMVRQTATNGALLLRVHRNEEWIQEMIFWLHQFQIQYVLPSQPPPINFFSNNPRYRSFLHHTCRLVKTSVEVIAHLDHKDIQRCHATTTADASLFLD
jgi:hypothetical protein